MTTHACISCHEILRHSIARCQVNAVGSARIMILSEDSTTQGQGCRRARVSSVSTDGRACAARSAFPLVVTTWSDVRPRGRSNSIIRCWWVRKCVPVLCLIARRFGCRTREREKTRACL